MSQDSNAPSNLRGAPPPDHVEKPQPVYEVFHGTSTTPALSHTVSTAGAPSTDTEGKHSTGRPPRATLKEGVQSIKSDDFLRIHQIPCAREGLMTGIGAGAVIGMGRYIVGAKAPRAANWAFGAFLLGSVVQWEYCQIQRRKERAAMARVVEVIDRKQAEKKAQAEEAARLRQEAAEKARQTQKSWYQFW